jgi:hypothetical protein
MDKESDLGTDIDPELELLLDTDHSNGLDETQVQERLNKFGLNSNYCHLT